MKNYNLYLALSDLSENKEIEQFELDYIDDIMHKITSQDFPNNRVFLCSTHDINEDSTTEILVTQSIDLIHMHLESIDLTVNNYPLTVHVQMYESYEDAYAVALGMREPNALCYNKNKQPYILLDKSKEMTKTIFIDLTN